MPQDEAAIEQPGGRYRFKSRWSQSAHYIPSTCSAETGRASEARAMHKEQRRKRIPVPSFVPCRRGRLFTLAVVEQEF